MISASRIQNRCPGCKAPLLGFYDTLLVSRSRAGSRPFHTSQSFTAAHRRRPLNPVRRFSTSRFLLQEPPEPASAPEERDRRTELKAEDTETIVRQARQTFGQTLPAGYLSDEEYQLYERLFGPPTRETRPEDVGIPFPGEGGDIVENQSSGNALLRETEDGGYEELDYDIENPTVVEEIPEVVDETAYTVDENYMTEDEIDADADAEATALLQAALAPEKEVTFAENPHQIDYLSAAANNQREYDALWKLQQDFERATLREAEEAAARDAAEAAEAASRPTPEEEEIDLEVQEYEEEIEEYADRFDEPPTERTHPNTALGLFGTHPSTVFLPAKSFVEPIAELLKRTSMTHIKEAAQKAFGGPGLPFSPATPSIKGKLPQKGVQLEAGHHMMSEIEADAYIATALPGMYATVMSTLVETRKRLGVGWLEDLLARDGGKGPRVLDVGAGGAGLAAWEEVVRAEWEILREKKVVKARDPPPGKKTVVVGSDALRHRISRFLNNTTFIPRLPDYMHSVEGSERMLDSDGTPAPRKTFDVIICSHVLMPMESAHRRKAVIDNLWAMLDPNGGVLIVLEKGHPRGFEAVADVRMRLLDEFIIPPHPLPFPEELVATSEQAELKRHREPGMIVAPCTNHRKCPMYLNPGLSPGRKDACHFEQRFIRPPFLQRVIGASARNHEDIKFSYLVVRRGMTPSDLPPPGLATYLQGKEAADRSFAGYDDQHHTPNPLSLPRSVLPPLKRHGHVTLQLCTPDAAIERWIIPKSFSKQAYRDARKSQWGDLWALGAKTRARANIRLGKNGSDSVLTDGGVRSRRAAEAARGGRPKVVEVLADPHRGMVGAREKHPKNRAPVERRTKGGRIVKIHDLLKEAGIDEMEDADDIEDREFLKGP